MLDAQSKRATRDRAIYQARVAAGKCVRCGRPQDRPDHSTCEMCFLSRREWRTLRSNQTGPMRWTCEACGVVFRAKSQRRYCGEACRRQRWAETSRLWMMDGEPHHEESAEVIERTIARHAARIDWERRQGLRPGAEQWAWARRQDPVQEAAGDDVYDVGGRR